MVNLQQFIGIIKKEDGNVVVIVDGETYAHSDSLKKGRHTSCSCGKTAKRPFTKLPNNLAVKRDILRNYKAAAFKRNYEFFLEDELFFKLIESECYYCKSSPSMKSYLSKDFRYNGVDRVNNNIGYTKENCVSCCDICNNSKSTLNLNDWENWIIKLYNNYIRNKNNDS